MLDSHLLIARRKFFLTIVSDPTEMAHDLLLLGALLLPERTLPISISEAAALLKVRILFYLEICV